MTNTTRKKLLSSAVMFAAAFAAAATASLISAPAAHAEASEGVEISYTTRSDEMLNENYLDWYRISADESKEYHIKSSSANGGNYGNNVLANAFDGNFDTFWETNTVNSDTFTNRLTVEFNQSVTIDRIYFATRRDGQWQKGFPLTATFLVSDDGTDYRAAARGVAEVKNNVVLYSFEKPLETKYLIFEYTDIYAGMTRHASASELIFLRPEEEIVGKVKNMFADYAHTRLKPEFRDRQTLTNLKAQLENHPLYQNNLDKYIERAFEILDGDLMTDYVNRQFTTDPAERGVTIQQRGDIFAYGNNLHFMFGLSNYMPAGIFANSGEKITVYVEADESQPLPKIVFTQFLTTYKYWQGGQTELKRGENVLTVPNFTHTASFTNAGGPIYIVNPYTSAEQNRSVKIYIEGGHTYPVFFKGGSEEKFLNDITDYVDYYNQNTDTAFDIVEVMADHMLVTAQASRAKQIYVEGGTSVQSVCENWDKYMQSLLEFNGVTFDKSDKYYDKRVEKLYLNVRIMEPFSSAADAYATGQHIGIRKNTGWETTALTGSGFGWGTSHEIGHIIEIGEYRVLEYTNNMVSNFNETYLDGLPSRGDHTKITSLLAPDSVVGNGGIASGGSYDNTYVAWWNIESVFPGYWGRYNNLFRYGVPNGYPTADGMSAVEKQVYYSSIATGTDTGYYFDRYGYRFNGNQFILSNASAAYKNAVSSLISQGKLSQKQYKFWYVSADTATLYCKYGEKLAIYSDKMTIDPLYIGKESGGYRINLPDNSAKTGHLGYEIIENGRVIGFTATSTYLDKTAYAEGYTPRYQIRAYDQRLNATAASDVWQFESGKAAARIGSQEYATLAQAVAAAKQNDVIVLLSDIYEENITIDKNLTITSDSREIYFIKTGDENIFNISSGASLTLRGSKSARIIFEGNGVARGGRVFSAAGRLDIEYADFQNLNGTAADGTVINLWGADNSLRLYACNFTGVTGTGRGGAVYVVANATISVQIDDCTFTGNRTTGQFNGGALFIGAPATITNSRFYDNRAEKLAAGALHVAGADSVIKNCEFSGNYANALNAAGGGALYIAAYCTVEDCTFTNNSAYTGANGGNGGAVYAAAGAKFTGCTFTQNKACNAGACYISSGNVVFENCTITSNSATSNAAAVWVNWSTAAVSASFEGCTVTQNSTGGTGIIYINYYFYAGYDDWGLGQKLLNFTNSTLKDNKSGGAGIYTHYNWLQLNAEGSTIITSVNKKIDLRSSYDNLYITLLDGNAPNGEIVKRSSSPMGEDIYEHFLLSNALANKYKLELGPTGNSLWLKQFSFTVDTEINGETSSDGVEYAYGDNFVLPAAPEPPEGYTFKGWEYGGNIYQPGETVSLDSGSKITAVFEQYLFRLKLVYADGESASAAGYRKGDVIHVSDLTAPTDANFAGWLYKGAVYMAGDKIIFDGRNDTFVAVYNTPEQPEPPEEDNGDNDSENDGDTNDNNNNGGNGNGTDNNGGTDVAPEDTDTQDKGYIIIISVIVAIIVAATAVTVALIVRKSKRR